MHWVLVCEVCNRLFTSEAGKSHPSLCPDCMANRPITAEEKRTETDNRPPPAEVSSIENDFPTLLAIINLLERKGLITREEILVERSRIIEKK